MKTTVLIFNHLLNITGGLYRVKVCIKSRIMLAKLLLKCRNTSDNSMN